jgi:hypothetical protein
MSFLLLNDWVIPVLKGGEYSPLEVGNRKPAFNGAPLTMRRGLKRRFRFGTANMDAIDAEGLIGMVMGQGNHWQYNTDLYDTRGLSPVGSVSATVIPAEDQQSTPATVYYEPTGISQSKFGAGALRVDPGTTNLLGTDTANAENAPTGYNASLGSTLTGETTIVLRGSKSVKCTTSVTNGSGINCPNITSGFTPGQPHTASVKVYTTEALPMFLAMTDDAGLTTYSWTTTPNRWELVEVTRTIDAAATFVRFGVKHNQPTAGKIFYCDDFQVEETDYATAWTEPADGARAAGVLDYGDILKARNFTFSAWVRSPTASPSSDAYLLWAGTNDDNNLSHVQIKRSSATNDIDVTYGTRDGTENLNYATTPWDGDWHHVALVGAANVGGNGLVKLYFDGAIVAQNAAPSRYPQMTTDAAETCYIGSKSTSNQWLGVIDDLMILPFAMGDDQISALAARTSAIPAWPRLELSGECNVQFDNRGVLVEGTDNLNSPYFGVFDSGTYKSYTRRVAFELHSVDDI